MNIYGKIVTAMVAFEHLTGMKPGLVYAGEKEFAQIKKCAGVPEDSFVGLSPSTVKSVSGLHIVEVKSDTFLSVGIWV